MQKGEKLLETRAPGKEKKVLRRRLDDLNTRWHDMKEKCTTRKDQIEKVLGLVDNYNNISAVFVSWLNETEKRLESGLEHVDDEDIIEKHQDLLEVRKSSQW